jgi:Family of unknown function (DUF6504)
MTRLWPKGDPVQVSLGEDGAPAQFFWGGRWHVVTTVANRWRVRSSWWLPAADAHREYIKLTTEDGLLCTLYRDLCNDAWYCTRLFD